MIEKIAALAKRLEQVPGVRVSLWTAGSGSAMLDVHRGEQMYQLAFSATRRFGVDEIRDHEGFLLSYAFTSDQFEPAADRLLTLVLGSPCPNWASNSCLGIAETVQDQPHRAEVEENLRVYRKQADADANRL